MTAQPGKAAARAAQDSTPFRGLARSGFIVIGVVHVVIGAVAVSIAQGTAGEADQGGAMLQVSRLPLGVVLLWIIAVGMLALALWQVATAFLVRRRDDRRTWALRIKYAGIAIAYVAIAATSLIYALGGRTDIDQAAETASAGLIATPGGVVLLVGVGLVIVGVGIGFVVVGVRRGFEKDLDVPGDGTRRAAVLTLGAVGYVAKGIAVAIVGALLVVAAVTADEQAAGGLDEALKRLALLPTGTVLLWLVGAGLIVYGVFCVARSRYAKM